MAQVLITGGSRGIGYELARSFMKRNHHVIITGVNIDSVLKAKDSLEKEFGKDVDFLLRI